MASSWWRRIVHGARPEPARIVPFYLAFRSRKLLELEGAHAARADIDALLERQGRPLADRQQWIAFLFDGTPAQPPLFEPDLQLADATSWLSAGACAHIAAHDWDRLGDDLGRKGWSAEAVALTVARFRSGPDLAGFAPVA